MPNLNKVMLMGTLTRDPEVKYLPNGNAITRIAVAINRNYKTASGEKREEVLFVDCDAFGKTAEVIAEHFKKGRPIYVEGRLKLDQWEDKTSGQKKSKMGVVVDSFEFLAAKESGGASAQRPASRPANAPADPLDPQDDGGDIPFN